MLNISSPSVLVNTNCANFQKIIITPCANPFSGLQLTQGVITLFRIRIRELREGAGFRSQQSFADAFGVAQTTVASWEGGKREPGHETTIKLAKFFNVTVDYLLGYDALSTSTNASIKQEHDGDGLDLSDMKLLKMYHEADEQKRAAIKILLGL